MYESLESVFQLLVFEFLYSYITCSTCSLPTVKISYITTPKLHLKYLKLNSWEYYWRKVLLLFGLLQTMKRLWHHVSLLDVRVTLLTNPNRVTNPKRVTLLHRTEAHDIYVGFRKCFWVVLSIVLLSKHVNLKQMTGKTKTYTSLAVVYAPLPNKASGAVHFIGRRP